MFSNGAAFTVFDGAQKKTRINILSNPLKSR